MKNKTTASAGPFANYSRQTTMPASHHSIFTGDMSFPIPNNNVKALQPIQCWFVTTALIC